MRHGVGSKTAHWVVPFMAAAGVWLGGCSSVDPSVVGEDVHWAEVNYLSGSTYMVTVWGKFNADDAYEVMGPPDNKQYYKDKPVNGNLAFLVELNSGIYWFTVNNTTARHSVDDVLVTLR